MTQKTTRVSSYGDLVGLEVIKTYSESLINKKMLVKSEKHIFN